MSDSFLRRLRFPGGRAPAAFSGGPGDVRAPGGAATRSSDLGGLSGESFPMMGPGDFDEPRTESGVVIRTGMG